LITDVPRIVAGLQAGQSFSAIPVPVPPVIRKGASGSFYDKGLEGASHHAVIPNVNTVDDLRAVWPRLSTDEKKLFDVIARAYLAAVMPDFRYRQTTATLDVGGFPFKASGRQPVDLGWRAAFPDWQPADEKGDEAQLLPALRNGEIGQLQNPTIEDKETRPPPRYNEGTLIEAMQNAWRFVDDEVLRERLKEAKGIGTPATRAEIIGGLKKRSALPTASPGRRASSLRPATRSRYLSAAHSSANTRPRKLSEKRLESLGPGRQVRHRCCSGERHRHSR
jgi:DNA topoisomerase-3